MGVVLVDTDVYDPFNDDYFENPVEAGLKCHHFPARGHNQAVKDWSRPPFKACLVGEPAFDTVSQRFMYGDKLKGIQHDFADDPEFTWVFVFMTLAAADGDKTKPTLATCNDGAGITDGSTICMSGPGSLTIGGRRFAPGYIRPSLAGATLSGIDLTRPKFLSFRMGTTKACIWNQTDMPIAPSVVGNGYAELGKRPVRGLSGRPWRTACSYNKKGQTDGLGMYYAMLYWDRYLTDIELNAQRAALSPYLIEECGLETI